MRDFLAWVLRCLLRDWRDEQARSLILHKAGLAHAFSREIDHLIRSAARMEGGQPNSKRVLLPTGYYFSSRSMFLDALFAIHLRLRGFSVVGLSAGEFFETECPLFAPYRRSERLKKNVMIERILWRRLLRMELIEISRFERKEDRDWAVGIVSSKQSLDELMKVEVDGFALGREASLVAINMANVPALADDEETRLRLKNHLLNVLRYFRAITRLFDQTQYDVLLSQFPFYYTWSVPFLVATRRGTHAYSYTPGDQEGTVIFAKSPKFYQGVDAKPEEQIAQGYSLIEANPSHSASTLFNSIMRSDKRLGISVDTSNEWKRVLRRPERIFEPITGVSRGPKRKVFVPLNVHCDLVTLQGSPLFPNYRDFLAVLVELNVRYEPNLQFIVKAHPAEALYGGDSGWKGCAELLMELGWPSQGDSVVIPHDSDFHADELWSQSDVVLTWTSTVALEAAANGLPTIQVGHSHVYEAGFILKPRNRADLFGLMDQLASGKILTDLLPGDFAEAAAAYGVSHYLSSQIDIPFLRGTEMSRTPLRESTTVEDLVHFNKLCEAMERVEKLESIFAVRSSYVADAL